MKKLLGIVVLSLLWCNVGFADDIKEFQIEGMSIGDSLLDHLSEEEIKKARATKSYKDKTYTSITFADIKKNLETYKQMNASYETNDINYTIVGLGGIIIFNNNFEACSLKQDEIYYEFDGIFKANQKISGSETKFQGDKSGQSTMRQSAFLLDNGDVASIQCFKFGKKHKTERKTVDHMRISLKTSDYNNWLNNIAFK